jgi:hypothetical protein
MTANGEQQNGLQFHKFFRTVCKCEPLTCPLRGRMTALVLNLNNY